MSEQQVRIEAVRVVDRYRGDLGDLDALAKSIADIGLINAVTLTPELRLIAGQRRLEACRLLGWEFVPARIADNLDEAAARLRAERDENTCRKSMTPEELVRLGLAMERLEAPKAKERQREHGGTAPGRNGNTSSSSQGSVERLESETAAVVGDALGIGRTRYYMAKAIIEHAEDEAQPDTVRETAQAAVQEMNQTGKITTAYNRLKEAKRAVPVETAAPPAEWVPAANDRSPRAGSRRRQIIAEAAVAGYTSEQIGPKANLLPETVRRLAREEGITIQADEALGTRSRKSIDSNRVVRETVYALDGLATGVQLVDFGQLDQAEIANWTASLAQSLRILNRLNKQLKEMAQQ